MLLSKVNISITFSFILLPFAFTHAQWSNDPTQNLQISNFGIFVDACEDGNGGAFIAWRTPTNTGIDVTVWMQWVDRYGYVRWVQPLQVLGQGDGQSDQQIIYSGNNTAIIAFGDRFDKGPHPIIPGYRLYKSRLTLNKVDTLGNFLWGSTGITASIDTTHNLDVVIAPDESGGAYLTWGDVYPLWGDRDSTIVRLQRIFASGQRLWGDSGRYVYKENSHLHPGSYLNNRLLEGIFFTYWKPDSGTVMESVNPDGGANWKIINDWPFGLFIPDSEGGAAWAYRYPKSGSTDHQILANRISSDGNLMWSDSGLVVDDNVVSQTGVYFNLLTDNSIVILYARNPTQPNFKTHIQIINDDGTFQFPDSSVSISNSPGTVAGGYIIVSDSLNFILAWVDYDTSHFDFRCQKFNKNMERLWGQGDVVYSTRNHEDAAIISDGRFGFIEIWDRFALPAGVFAQQVSKNGNLGEVLVSINSQTNNNLAKKLELHQNYPNPFNSTTYIPFSLSQKAEIKIIIYNSLGQRIRTLFLGKKLPGKYVLIWNGRDDAGKELPSGTYYIELQSNQTQKVIKSILIK